jgi:hypothetical protein
MAFTKFLTIYQKYHTGIHPLHHSPLSSLPPILEIVSTVSFFHFHICVHRFCTIFILLHHFATSPKLISTPHLTPPSENMFLINFIPIAGLNFAGRETQNDSDLAMKDVYFSFS